MRRLEYEASPKHGTRPYETARGVSNPAPRNGQDALDASLQIKDTSPRRIGIDYQSQEFVVFDQTRSGVFHGHVRSWDELDQPMKNTLQRAGTVDGRGRILSE